MITSPIKLIDNTMYWIEPPKKSKDKPIYMKEKINGYYQLIPLKQNPIKLGLDTDLMIRQEADKGNIVLGITEYDELIVKPVEGWFKGAEEIWNLTLVSKEKRTSYKDYNEDLFTEKAFLKMLESKGMSVIPEDEQQTVEQEQ